MNAFTNFCENYRILDYHHDLYKNLQNIYWTRTCENAMSLFLCLNLLCIPLRAILIKLCCHLKKVDAISTYFVVPILLEYRLYHAWSIDEQELTKNTERHSSPVYLTLVLFNSAYKIRYSFHIEIWNTKENFSSKGPGEQSLELEILIPILMSYR